MKWMLAGILSVALVTPALATVDVTLTAADGTGVAGIVLAPGATTGTIQIQSGLSKTNPAAILFGWDAALKMVSAPGATGVFKITGRNSAGGIVIAGDTMNSKPGATDKLINNTLGAVATDNIGWFTNAGMWDDTNLPGRFDTFTIEATGLKVGDEYTIMVAPAKDGSYGASDDQGNLVEVGQAGSVLVKVTPEPASLLLLALGALFLRRRHA